MKRAYRTAGIAFCFIIVGGLITLAACSNQGEGERCDSLNGDDDCIAAEDLACFPAALLTNTTSDRCCPRDRTLASNPVCKTPVDVVGNDAAAPADTGPPTPADATVAPADAATTNADGGGIVDAANDG